MFVLKLHVLIYYMHETNVRYLTLRESFFLYFCNKEFAPSETWYFVVLGPLAGGIGRCLSIKAENIQIGNILIIV